MNEIIDDLMAVGESVGMTDDCKRAMIRDILKSQTPEKIIHILGEDVKRYQDMFLKFRSKYLQGMVQNERLEEVIKMCKLHMVSNGCDSERLFEAIDSVIEGGDGCTCGGDDRLENMNRFLDCCVHNPEERLGSE